MRLKPYVLSLLAAVAGAVPLASAAQDAKPANEQVVVPEVDRRDVKVPRIPSNDFEAGLFTGVYSTESFGASVVSGVRLGYHITEDFFVEGTYARTKVSDESFRQILPGGVFGSEKETLTYYNVSLGYNILPGEIFLGSKRAKASTIYIIAGVGSTKFIDQLTAKMSELTGDDSACVITRDRVSGVPSPGIVVAGVLVTPGTTIALRGARSIERGRNRIPLSHLSH